MKFEDSAFVDLDKEENFYKNRKKLPKDALADDDDQI